MALSAQGKAVLERLRALKLLQGRGQADGLLRLCHKGRLKGGLSIALSVTPDEAVGALTHAMDARGFRVLDVRGRFPMQLHVAVGKLEEKWEVEGLEGLVHNLNDLYRGDGGTKRIVVLGEWEDMLQLWCVSREALEVLQRERWFEIRNWNSVFASPAAQDDDASSDRD
ncbi:MAG: hypothetical protein K1X89_07220 [Myxococcaceae bacterium]|nr:hypothetical protein [Myxococcaceae bacterium]